MNGKYLFALITILLTTACSVINHYNKKEDIPINNPANVYRVSLKDTCEKKIWIVDGLQVRENIYPEFLYGGNGERYLFIPKDEIWIDNAITAEELKYTLAHELNERELMAKNGLRYADAHDSSLALELKMRRADTRQNIFHENSLHKVSPTDCDNLKEIKNIPDSIRLKNIYRCFYAKRNGNDIWIVDGSNVRRDIFPDFGFSGNDLAYHFIPRNEIWIDSEISCEELEFSITCELTERDLMKNGLGYDDAYMVALKNVDAERKKLSKLSAEHPPLIISKQLERDYGTASEKE